MDQPDWLTDLDTALFARLPRNERLDLAGIRVEARRTLEETRDGLALVERWHDPRTDAVLRQWSLPLNPAAFVGVPPWLLTQTVDVIVRAMAEARPLPRPRTEQAGLNPGRFAQDPSVQVRPR